MSICSWSGSRLTRLVLELLEDRTVPSWVDTTGGSYIVEPWASSDYEDVQIQPTDQKIVAAGYRQGNLLLARYDATTGDPDATFGSGGFATTTGSGRALVLQADGKPLVAGVKASQLMLTRFTTSGTLDSSFGTAGSASASISGTSSTSAEGVALQSTGKIIAVGTALPRNGGGNSSFVARFTTNGAMDSGKNGFGTGKNPAGYTVSTFGAPYSYLYDVAVQPDDKIVVMGRTSLDGNNSHILVARYTASGLLDTTFNGTGYSTFLPSGMASVNVAAGALQSDGKIVIVGSGAGLDGSSDGVAVRFLPTGALDTTFGGTGHVRFDVDGTASQTYERANGVTMGPGGKILVSGEMVPITPDFDNHGSVFVARLNIADGSLDNSFGNGGYKLAGPPPGIHDFRGGAVTLLTDGTLIVAGADYWGNTGSDRHLLLVRIDGSSTAPASAAMLPSTTSSSPVVHSAESKTDQQRQSNSAVADTKAPPTISRLVMEILFQEQDGFLGSLDMNLTVDPSWL